MRALFNLFVLAALAVGALIVFSPRYNYSIALDLPTKAADGAFVSVGSPAEDVDMVCPVGIEFAAEETLMLLDADTRRILTIDAAAGAVLAAEPIALDRGIRPLAMAASGGDLWLWITDSSGKNELTAPFARIDGAFGPSFSDRASEFQDAAEEKFRVFGLSRADEGAGAVAEERPSQAEWIWEDRISTASGEVYAANFEIAGDSLILGLARPDGTSLQTEIKAARAILSARLLKATAAGDVFLLIKNWDPNSAAFDIEETVHRLRPGGGEAAVYDVPLSENDCVARQHVAVSESGEPYAMRVLETGVSLLRLEERSRWSELRRRIEGRLGRDLPHFRAPAFLETFGISPASAQTEAVDGSIARADVVANACLYLNQKWTPAASNIELKPALCTCDAACAKGWSSPIEKVVAPNVEVTGLPYSWGGSDSLADFNRKIGEGRPAGNVCTEEDHGIADGTDRTRILTAGVDCSGLVTRALGVASPTKKYSTSTLPGVSDEWPKLKMRSGDIAVKSGRHVRMLLHWKRPAINGAPWDDVVMIESSTDCDGVCETPYSLDQLSGAGGYVLYKPKAIVESGALPAGLIRCEAP